MTRAPAKSNDKRQLLHLVFGGELTSLDSHEFKDLHHVDIIGVFPDYQSAYNAWKAAAHRSVDNAMMRYYVVHLHKLLEPVDDGLPEEVTKRS